MDCHSHRWLSFSQVISLCRVHVLFLVLNNVRSFGRDTMEYLEISFDELLVGLCIIFWATRYWISFPAVIFIGAFGDHILVNLELKCSSFSYTSRTLQSCAGKNWFSVFIVFFSLDVSFLCPKTLFFIA